MSRVVLFNAVDVPSNWSGLMPDVGLASLAGSLIAAGHTVEIVDVGGVSALERQMDAAQRAAVRAYAAKARAQAVSPSDLLEMMALELSLEAALGALYTAALADVDRRIGWRNVDLLGLKLWAGPGAALSLALVAGIVRRHPALTVVAGGPLATLRPEALLREHPCLRAVVVGYGEESVVGLAGHAAGRTALASVPNLVWRDGATPRATERRTPDPAALPFPCYDPAVYPALQGDEKLPVLCIDESRGCPMDCHFCAHRALSGGDWLRLPADRVVAQMDDAHAQTGAVGFRFSGSFTAAATFRAVAERLAARGAPYRWSAFAHVGGFDTGDLPLLARGGLVSLFFGVESGAESLLRTTLGKPVDPRRTRRVLQAALDAGLFVCGSVIVPAPGETPESEAETRALLTEVFAGRENGAALVLPPLLQPGSRWWDEPGRFGFEGDPEAVLDALCSRRTRHLLPMDVFEPLPFRLDGADQRAVAARTAAFTRTLRAAGVLTNMGHDAALFARLAGLEPRALLDLEHDVFLTADAVRARALVRALRERGGALPPRAPGAARAPADDGTTENRRPR